MDKIWVVTAELDYFHNDEVETEVQSVGYFTDKQAAIDAVMAYEQNPEYFTEDEIARRLLRLQKKIITMYSLSSLKPKNFMVLPIILILQI